MLRFVAVAILPCGAIFKVLQIFGAISQIQHTVLHFGPMLTGTAYYLLEQHLQVLHINL
jgi:hypothetical protein